MIPRDYFTEKEAAEYCCVCLSKFQSLVKDYAICHGNFGKKKLYRKADLQRLIETEAFNGKRLSA